MVEKVKEKYSICILCVSLTNFPEPLSVLAFMFYHFEPDNDYAIRCIQRILLCYQRMPFWNPLYSYWHLMQLPVVIDRGRGDDTEIFLSSTLAQGCGYYNGLHLPIYTWLIERISYEWETVTLKCLPLWTNQEARKLANCISSRFVNL
jgi:hypothetical protein